MSDKKWIAAAVFISLFALIVSFISLCDDISPGKVQILKPSGYGFIREIDPFPSDHIVLPLVWENSGGRPVYVRHPYLVLRELGPEGKQTGNNYCFFVAGEYPDISTKFFQEGHTIRDSFIIDPHSTEKRVLLFHIKDWWDNRSAAYNFTFAGGKNYSVEMGYNYSTYGVFLHSTKKDKAPDKAPLFEMNIPMTLNNLSANRTKYFWDYFCNLDAWTCETRLNYS